MVIDLGLVKIDPALRHAASPPTTQTGRVLCTPGFTSPEQASGQLVDRRSDVYSLGITLYRTLAGRLPFHAARGQPLFVLFNHHIHDTPTGLADAATDAEIPAEVVHVIESALAKDPTPPASPPPRPAATASSTPASNATTALIMTTTAPAPSSASTPPAATA